MARSQSTGMGHRQPLHQFELRSILFWFMPYVAICCVTQMAFREPTSNPGRGLPIDDWRRLVTLGVITVVWAALVWEDRRARRRNSQDRDQLDI